MPLLDYSNGCDFRICFLKSSQGSAGRWSIREIYFKTVQKVKMFFLTPLVVGDSGWFVLQDKLVSDFLLSIFSDSPTGV